MLDGLKDKATVENLFDLIYIDCRRRREQDIISAIYRGCRVTFQLCRASLETSQVCCNTSRAAARIMIDLNICLQNRFDNSICSSLTPKSFAVTAKSSEHYLHIKMER